MKSIKELRNELNETYNPIGQFKVKKTKQKTIDVPDDDTLEEFEYDIIRSGKKVGQLEMTGVGTIYGKLHGKDLPELSSYRGKNPEQKLQSFLKSKTGARWAKNVKELSDIIGESKQEDIADLKALLKNPDPKVAKNYGGIEGYKKMIQSKIDKLMKEETELEEANIMKDLDKKAKRAAVTAAEYMELRNDLVAHLRNLKKTGDLPPQNSATLRAAIHRPAALTPKQVAELYLSLKGDVRESAELDEALTRAQRIKRSQIAKRNKAKIQRALQKGKKKKASTETLQKRAHKKARDLLYTKLLKGRNRADVSAGEQERIEKKLDKMQGGIKRIAKKLLPQLKKAEQEKLKKKSEE